MTSTKALAPTPFGIDGNLFELMEGETPAMRELRAGNVSLNFLTQHADESYTAGDENQMFTHEGEVEMPNVQTGAAKGKRGKGAQPAGFTVDVVPARDLPTDWLYNYNCRHPSPKSKAYKSMRQTIQERPEMFGALNSGIVVAEFDGREYILDGGHSYLAIQDARKAGEDLSHVSVQVRRERGLTVPEMVARSIGLNNKVTPPLLGERDLAGDWDKIKSFLADKYRELYEFRPNTLPGAPYDVGFLVSLLHGWWPGFNRRGRVDAVYGTGKGLLVKLYQDDKYLPILPRINEAIEFWSLVAKTIAEQPARELNKLSGVKKPGRMTLPNGEELDARIPEPYIWLMYTAVGQLLDDKAEWTKDAQGMFKKSFKNMWKALLVDYRECGQNPSQLGKTRGAYDRQAIALLKA